MRKKKILAYKDEQIKKIAINLRKSIRKATMKKESELGKLHTKAWKQQNKIKSQSIQQQREQLLEALGKSICMCPRCRKSDRDMIFNPFLEKWWCAQCYQEMRDSYLNDKSLFSEEGEEEYYKTFTL